MSRVRLAALTAVVGAATVVAVGGSSSTAMADGPVQTGWWNATSGGDAAAPAPTTPEGGLHVAVAPDQVLAYSAVLYTFPDDATGTLELQVAGSAATPVVNPNSPSTNPAMSVRACPTTDPWDAGDDQPMDDAPAYDCSLRSFEGNLSADAKTVTFLVDDGGQVTPGQLSLAIIPVLTNEAPGAGTKLPADVTQPYSLDFSKPEATSLLVTLAPVLPTEGGDTTTGTTGTATGTDTGGATGSSTSGGGGSVPSFTGGGGLPDGQTGVEGSDTAPVVAPTTPAGTNAAPAAVAMPQKNDTAHNAALALLILLAMAIAATGNGQLQRAPRLLGGSARHAMGAAAPAAGAAVASGDTAVAAAAVAAPSLYGSRGLGRFAKPRSEPPRPIT
jgi:hypothetical protein